MTQRAVVWMAAALLVGVPAAPALALAADGRAVVQGSADEHLDAVEAAASSTSVDPTAAPAGPMSGEPATGGPGADEATAVVPAPSQPAPSPDPQDQPAPAVTSEPSAAPRPTPPAEPVPPPVVPDEPSRDQPSVSSPRQPTSSTAPSLAAVVGLVVEPGADEPGEAVPDEEAPDDAVPDEDAPDEVSDHSIFVLPQCLDAERQESRTGEPVAVLIWTDLEGVQYLLDGEELSVQPEQVVPGEPGDTHIAYLPAGRYTVGYRALDGFVLAGGDLAADAGVVVDDSVCAGPAAEPTPEPTTEPEPEPVSTPGPTSGPGEAGDRSPQGTVDGERRETAGSTGDGRRPTTAVVVAASDAGRTPARTSARGSDDGVGPSALARTGTEVAVWAGAGLGLLAAGALALVVSRRRA